MAVFHSPGSDSLRSAPLWPIAVGLLFGIGLDNVWHPMSWLYLAPLGCSAILLALPATRHYLPALFILIGAVACGGLLHEHASGRERADQILRLVQNGTGLARMRGEIISEPRIVAARSRYFAPWSFRDPQTTFTLDIRSWEGADGWFEAPLRIRVNVLEPVLDLEIGDAVEVFARLSALSGPRNPGGVDWAAVSRHNGITLQATCTVAKNVSHLHERAAAPHRSVIDRIRLRVAAAMSENLHDATDEQIGLLEAMVLGQRSRVDRTLNDVWIRAGCVHFLTVSGLHLAIPVSFAWWLGRRLRLRNRACCVLMMLAIVGYLVIAEPRPPILRAALMGFLYCGARWLGRVSAGINWLAAAAIILAIATPSAVLTPGFQYSFAAVAGIILLSPSVKAAVAASRRAFERRILNDPYAEADRTLAELLAQSDRGWPRLKWHVKRIFFVRAVLYPLLISFAAWAAVAPLVAFYFQTLHPLSPFVAVALAPLVYVVVLLTLMNIACEIVLPGLGAWIASLLLPVEQALIGLADGFGGLPAAEWHVPQPSSWWLASCYLAMLLFVVRFKPHPRGFPDNTREDAPNARLTRPPKKTMLSAMLLASALTLGSLTIAAVRPTRPANQLWVTALSVGAGSATVIELPNGETWVYDCGSTLVADTGKRILVPYLRHRGIEGIDGVFVSHANLDHFNGIPSAMGMMPVGPIHVGPRFHAHATGRTAARHFLKTVPALGGRVETLDPTRRTWIQGGVTFEWLWPNDETPADLSINDASVVLRLTFAGHSILLTGDIEEAAQRALLESFDLRADVLWLPHHGSVERTTEAFIAAVRPQVCVRSSRQPRSETINGIDRLVGDAVIHNTADVGTVRVGIGPGGIQIRTPCAAGLNTATNRRPR